MIFPVLVLSTLLAQPQTPNQPKPASISGRVVHAGTGEPLRKATVSLIPSGTEEAIPRTAITAPEGTFSFDNVTAGKYQITASKTGFLSQRMGSAGGRISASSSITVQAGQATTGVDLKLTPQGAVTGRVVDGDGDPVQGAQITIVRIISTGGKTGLTPASVGYSNDLGEFRVASLPQGRYLVSATVRNAFRGGPGPGGPPSRSRVPEGVKDDWVLTYFPSSTTASGASPVEVRAGMDTAGVTIQIRRAPILTVSGHVSGNLGPAPEQEQSTRRGPGGGSRVGLMLVSGDRDASFVQGPGQTATVDGSGKFVFHNVTPGAYQVIAQRFDRRPVTLARLPIQVGNNDIEGLNIALQEPVTVTGILKFDALNNSPVDQGSTRLYLQPAESGSSPGFGMGGNSAEATLKPDGGFSISGVSRERLVLYAYNLPQGAYLRSVKVGGQEMIDTGLDLTTAGPQVQVEAIIGMNGSIIQGTLLQDGKPVPAYTMSVHPEPAHPNQPWLTKTTTTDANGKFTFRALPPGEYRVFGWEEIAREFLTDTEFLKRFETSGVRVTLKESAPVTVEVSPVATTESK
ncbi:MAG: carboxypeptidase regulatory-like domain-containing protein [Acidobacteria bacterium]|nr:carboxypeptidase regulatory-like domain-containing protein [Acidobacteriota bacterium]